LNRLLFLFCSSDLVNGFLLLNSIVSKLTYDEAKMGSVSFIVTIYRNLKRSGHRNEQIRSHSSAAISARPGAAEITAVRSVAADAAAAELTKTGEFADSTASKHCLLQRLTKEKKSVPGTLFLPCSADSKKVDGKCIIH